MCIRDRYLYAVSRSDKWGLYAVALQPYSDRVLFPYIALVVLCGVLLCALRGKETKRERP